MWLKNKNNQGLKQWEGFVNPQVSIDPSGSVKNIELTPSGFTTNQALDSKYNPGWKLPGVGGLTPWRSCQSPRESSQNRVRVGFGQFTVN